MYGDPCFRVGRSKQKSLLLEQWLWSGVLEDESAPTLVGGAVGLICSNSPVDLPFACVRSTLPRTDH